MTTNTVFGLRPSDAEPRAVAANDAANNTVHTATVTVIARRVTSYSNLSAAGLGMAPIVMRGESATGQVSTETIDNVKLIVNYQKWFGDYGVHGGTLISKISILYLSMP